jgi:hypothetical protein
MEQMPEHQPRRTGADDANLCSHRSIMVR